MLARKKNNEDWGSDPRSSTLYVVKQQCWEKAERVPGRGSGTLAWLQDCTALYLSDNITKMWHYVSQIYSCKQHKSTKAGLQFWYNGVSSSATAYWRINHTVHHHKMIPFALSIQMHIILSRHISLHKIQSKAQRTVGIFMSKMIPFALSIQIPPTWGGLWKFRAKHTEP